LSVEGKTRRDTLVSVIIPTYNRAHLVTDALDSVYEQTYCLIECIVVDDGSTDDTVEVVKVWKRAHSGDDFCARLLRQENHGAPVARNHGVEAARGDFLLFLDSDDVLPRDAINTLRQTIIKEGVDAAYGDVLRVRKNGQNERQRQRPSSASDVVNMQKGAPITSSAMIRQEAIQGVRWREELSCAQEFAFFLDLSLRGVRFAYEPSVVLKKREDPNQDSISGQDDIDYPLTISQILVGVESEIRSLGIPENMQYDRGLVHFAGILHRKGHRDRAKDLFRRAYRGRALRSALQNWRSSVFLPAALTPRWSAILYKTLWR
jgi:glycosyltransferase involved in cell wall biosynthesis